MIGTLVLCGAFAATLAAPTDQVCIPAQWESKVFSKIAQVVEQKPVVLGLMCNISTDYMMKKQVMHQIVDANGQQMRVSTFLDYSKVR